MHKITSTFLPCHHESAKLHGVKLCIQCAVRIIWSILASCHLNIAARHRTHCRLLLLLIDASQHSTVLTPTRICSKNGEFNTYTLDWLQRICQCWDSDKIWYILSWIYLPQSNANVCELYRALERYNSNRRVYLSWVELCCAVLQGLTLAFCR